MTASQRVPVVRRTNTITMLAVVLIAVGACRSGVDGAEKKPTQAAPASAPATASAVATASATAVTPEDDVRRVVDAAPTERHQGIHVV